MIRNAVTSTLSLALALIVAPGCDEADELDTAAAEHEEFRVASDPSMASSYTACVDAASFAGVSTVIRYPMGHNCLSSVDDSPIVLLLHGATYPYNTYSYLLDHLAENGFIVVSANILADDDDDPPAHQDAADLAEDVLDDMLSSWALASYIDPTRLSLIGHSRGGQTVRYLADNLAGGGDSWDVKAIVGLASKAGTDHLIVGDETNAFMVLHGTSDNDQKPNRGYENYDWSGTEDSIVFGSPNLLHKSMKLIQGATHARFSQESGLTAQAHVAKGYVLAFLARHAMGDSTWYDDYIRGDAVPFGWASQIVSQVSEGYLRKVVDNFEDGAVGTSTIGVGILGGGVTTSLGVSATVLDLATETDYQHQTHALEASATSANAYIEWAIPAAEGNLLMYEHLSLRIGQVSGAASSNLFVQIRNNGVWSPSVKVGNYGTIPMPMSMCENILLTLNCIPKVYNHMGTVRIPTAAFGQHDDVEAVRLVFSVKALDRDYLVDSIEFVESVFEL